MAIRALLFALLFVLVSSSPLLAERPNLSPRALEAEATHVLIGLVKAVYSRAAASERGGEEEVVTHYLVELEVAAAEKGEGFAKGDLAYVRCWLRTKSRPKPTPGPGGHDPIPEAGQWVRAYVAKGEYGPTRQADNGITAVYPNGFVALRAPQPSGEAAPQPTRTPARPQAKSRVLAVDASKGIVTIALRSGERAAAGVRFVVARGPDYVATVEVLSVRGDLVTARIVKPLQKAPIQAGDQIYPP